MRGDYSSERASSEPYAQDHSPVIEQDEVVGHAVRTVYVYAVEEIDNQKNFESIGVHVENSYEIQWTPQLLEGVNVLEANGKGSSFSAIPYFPWSNRDIGKMKVWLPYEKYPSSFGFGRS